MTSHNIQPIEHADLKVQEACRIVIEMRAFLDTDPIAVRGRVERLARLLGATGPGEADGTARGGLAPWQARRLREHIAANLDSPLPLSELATLVRLSRGHLARAFRQSFGVSPHMFIIEQRLRRAKRLILESEAPLAQIALACGMTDQSHLTRRFTRDVGMSPAAWRRRHSTGIVAQAA